MILRVRYMHGSVASCRALFGTEASLLASSCISDHVRPEMLASIAHALRPVIRSFECLSVACLFVSLHKCFLLRLFAVELRRYRLSRNVPLDVEILEFSLFFL